LTKVREFLQQGRYDELWQMCCGFTELSLEQFMAIQKRLLLEQMDLLKKCKLGKKIMRGARPETVEEFREEVPLTTYVDYCPELSERNEAMLPMKPLFWQHTSGRSGEYQYKWVPITERFYEEWGKVCTGAAIFATCNGNRQVALREGWKLLYALAARPYTTGFMAEMMAEQAGFHYLPSLEESEDMAFEDRIKEGFKQALSQGMDGFFGLAGILLAIGERFRSQSNKVSIIPLLSQPRILLRLIKGIAKSKLARRPLLPRDLWSLKGIVIGGTDSSIYKEKIKQLWGKYPLDAYVGSEGGTIAMQTWDYDTMTFVPNLNFLEFIPEKEYFKWQLDHSYQPKTVLLDEVKAGGNYEIVITSLHGGAFVRYRVGDMVRITSLQNNKLGIDIPQMAFESRADDLIDLAGFTRLTEKIIWQAIENSGVSYEDWTARKEVRETPVLHLYLESKDDYITSGSQVATAIHEQLSKLDSDYAALEAMLGLKPLEVTLLPKGAFPNYISQRRAEGADLAHLKPPHINPSDRILSLLGVGVEVIPTVKRVTEVEAPATR